MKACYLFKLAGLVAAGVVGYQPAAAQTWPWAAATQPQTNGNHVVVTASVVDPWGNLLVTGYTMGIPRFGTLQLPPIPINSQKWFVARQSASGQWLWATTNELLPGTSGYSGGISIEVDGAGNAYVLGQASPNCQFGAPALLTTTQEEFVLAKVDSAGNWVSARAVECGPVNNGGASLGKMIRDAATGAYYVAGRFRTQASFGSVVPFVPATASTQSSSNDAFVGRLDSAGNWQWVTRLGASYDVAQTMIDQLALDPGTGDLLAIGSFTEELRPFQPGKIQIGPDVLTNAGSNSSRYWLALDGFIGRFASADGTGLEGIAIGSSGEDEVGHLVVDLLGRLTFTGLFTDQSFTLGSHTLLNPNRAVKRYVAQLLPTGTFSWVKPLEGIITTYDLQLTATGSIDAVGRIIGPVDFGNGLAFTTPTDSAGSYFSNPFMGTFDSQTGTWQQVRVERPIGSAFFTHLRHLPSGDAYVLGSVWPYSSLRLGATTIRTTQFGRNFIARYQQAQLAVADGPTEAGWSVWPNPARASTRLTVVAGPIELVDGLGRVARAYPGGTTTLDLSGLPAGLYVVRGGGVARRLVVE